MEKDPFWIIVLALSSGLVGSVLALVGGYFVQKVLSDREVKRRMKKRSFIQVVEFSVLIGAFYAFREFGKSCARIFLEKQLKPIVDAFNKDSGEFEISHAICAYIAEELHRFVETTSEDQMNKLMASLNIHKASLEKFLDFKVPDELLLDLPDEGAIEYSFFRLNSQSLYRCLTLWLNLVESTRNGLLDAKEIHSQWISFVRIFESAHKVLKCLIAKGEIDDKQSNALISRMYSYVTDSLFASLTDNFKIEKARKYIAEKPWEKVPNKLPPPAQSSLPGSPAKAGQG